MAAKKGKKKASRKKPAKTRTKKAPRKKAAKTKTRKKVAKKKAGKKKRARKKTVVAKRPPGRPRGVGQTVTDKVMHELFKWLAEGNSIREFCREKKCSRTQVTERVNEPGFAEPIARAREMGEEKIIDEMKKIADEPMFIELVSSKGKKYTIVHPDDVQFRKVQLWMREKLLVWNNPGKYGQKTQIQKDVNHRFMLSDAERDIRVDQLVRKAMGLEVSVEFHEEEEQEELNE